MELSWQSTATHGAEGQTVLFAQTGNADDRADSLSSPQFTLEKVNLDTQVSSQQCLCCSGSAVTSLCI